MQLQDHQQKIYGGAQHKSTTGDKKFGDITHFSTESVVDSCPFALLINCDSTSFKLKTSPSHESL